MILRFVFIFCLSVASLAAQTQPNVAELANKISSTNVTESAQALESLRVAVYQVTSPRAETARKALTLELLKLADVNHTMQVRREALLLISIIGGADAVPAIAKLLVDQEVRNEARMALERIGGFEGSRAIADEMHKSTGDFKHSLLYSLGQIGNNVALEALAITTHSKEQMDVVATLDALSHIPGTDARVKVPDYSKYEEQYLPSLMSSWVTWLETQSIHKKIAYLDPIYAGIIKNAPQEHIVCAALIGITRFYPQVAREPAIIALLNNPAYTVRVEAVRSLIAVGGDEESIKKLKEARDSADKEKQTDIDKVLKAWETAKPVEPPASPK